MPAASDNPPILPPTCCSATARPCNTPGAGDSTDRLFTINGTAAAQNATIDASGSGAINFTNAGNLAYGTTGQTRTLILTGTSTDSNTLAATVANNGAGATSLTKNGAGAWVLSGANAYTGATAVNAGTLEAGVASVAGVSGAFGNNSAVTLANVVGATLDITGYDTQIGSLAGGGTAGGGVNLGAATLTVGGDGTNTTYAGVITSSGSPAVSLVKTGGGALTLSAANTLSGGVTVNGGTLELTNADALGIGAGKPTVTLGTGATLKTSIGANVDFGNDIVLAGNATVLGTTKN